MFRDSVAMNKNKSLPIFTLLPPFYDKPPHKDVKIYLKKIEEEFNIKIEKYYYDHYAFGNDVFIINDRYVFRFPRVEQTKKHLKHEIDFLKFLKNRVAIKVPQYIFVSKNFDFAGYKIIQGDALSPSVFKSINKKNKEKVIDELITFINAFHSINLDEFTRYNPFTKEYFISIETRIEKELREKLFPKLTKNEIEMIKKFYEESKKYIQNIPTYCPTHGDLYAYNVIWNKNTSEVGVIDFSDYMITDPARDFEVFYDFGPEYAETAYRKYRGPKDEQFLKRAQIYWKLHGIYTLLSSFLDAHISFDYAYKNFFKRKFSL